VFEDMSGESHPGGTPPPPPAKTRIVPVKTDLIAGADGAFSAVRTRLMKLDRFEYSQSYLSHGYKELHIPPAKALGLNEDRFGGFALDPAALHIWPRGGSMMIALPNKDRSFTCTLFWPFSPPDPHSFAALSTPEQVTRFFGQHYPDVPGLCPTLAEDYFKNPTSSLVTVRCWPWVSVSPRGGGATVIMGDAAHAIVPFYGQGMNCAFEDVRTFAECLDSHGDNLPAALAEFQSLRKPNADAIADLALANFIEMRDSVASPVFRFKKKASHALHALVPSLYTPLYDMISFSTIPYAEAREIAARQTRVITWIVLILAALVLGVIVGVWCASS
jgi:kynurenine 3-monooxygenase